MVQWPELCTRGAISLTTNAPSGAWNSSIPITPTYSSAFRILPAISTASIRTVRYWNGTSWADISDQDNTANGGATFAQDGQITWTVPSDWVGVRLDDTTATPDTTLAIGEFTQPLFWTRWEVSLVLDSSVNLDHLVALNQSTAYAELVEGQTLEQAVLRDLGGQSAIKAVTDNGTANLIINAGARSKFQG